MGRGNRRGGGRRVLGRRSPVKMDILDDPNKEGRIFGSIPFHISSTAALHVLINFFSKVTFPWKVKINAYD